MGRHLAHPEYRLRSPGRGFGWEDVLGELGQDCERVGVLRDLYLEPDRAGGDAGEVCTLSFRHEDVSWDLSGVEIGDTACAEGGLLRGACYEFGRFFPMYIMMSFLKSKPCLGFNFRIVIACPKSFYGVVSEPSTQF